MRLIVLVLILLGAAVSGEARAQGTTCPSGFPANSWPCLTDPAGNATAGAQTDYVYTFRPSSGSVGTNNGFGPQTVAQLLNALTTAQVTTLLNGATVPGMALSGSTSIATGSTTALTFASRFAQRLNIRDGCGSVGAVGNGTADDSGAIASCINLANTLAAAGTPVVVYAPAGNYLVKATSLPSFTYRTGLVGDGPHQTYFTIDPAYAGGSVFSWNDTWQGAAYTQQYGGSLVVANDKSGPLIQGLTVAGNTAASNQQDAFVFFGRVDHATMEDVAIFYLNGQCIRSGKLAGAETQSFLRESYFQNIWCWSAGTPTLAAVDFSAVQNASGDNQIDRMNIFAAAGPGLQIHGADAAAQNNHYIFHTLRVEQSGADDVDLGVTGDLGRTTAIWMFGLQLTTPGATNAGFFGLSVGNATVYDYDIHAWGSIGACLAASCNGLKVDFLGSSEFHLQISETTSVAYTANVSPDVVLDGLGTEQSWVYSIATAALAKTQSPGAYTIGDPSAAAAPPSMSSCVPDGTATGCGNANGAGSVMLQARGARTAASQVASGFNSCLVAGSVNTAAGSNDCVIGGTKTLLTGTDTFAGGAYNATDRGHYGAVVQASGGFSGAQGSAQTESAVMRCQTTTTGGSACRLTTDQNAASAANCYSIPAGFHYGFTITLAARDGTGTNDYTWQALVSMSSQSGGASTVTVANSAPITLSNGTVTNIAFAVTADTTLGCLNATFTSPTTATHVWEAVAVISPSAQVQ